VAEAPATSGESKEKAVRELFEKGVAAYEAGRYDEAKDLFGKILQSDPRWVSAQYNLGLVAERQADFAQAEAAYQAALRLDSSHGPSLLNLGRLYRLRGDFQSAILLYEKALAEPGKQDNVELLNNLTAGYRMAKEFAKAEATARRVLTRARDNIDALKNLALIYYDQGRYRLAETVSSNARKIDDRDPGVHNNLGLIYLKLDEPVRALAQFKQAVALDGKFAPAHLNWGTVALAYRDYPTAQRELAEAVALEPASYHAHLHLAYALDGQKARDARKGLEAGAEFEKVLAIRPNQLEAVCGAGWAYAIDRAAWDKATAYLRRCRDADATGASERAKIDSKLKSLTASETSQEKVNEPRAER
jgi:tetratricopeptide (TPR) repeat protein